MRINLRRAIKDQEQKFQLRRVQIDYKLIRSKESHRGINADKYLINSPVFAFGQFEKVDQSREERRLCAYEKNTGQKLAHEVVSLVSGLEGQGINRGISPLGAEGQRFVRTIHWVYARDSINMSLAHYLSNCLNSRAITRGRAIMLWVFRST